ncbi:MAG: response regulator [Candidatus Omnitrophica bacterium]|nr:response regulator [Candidatus Omnitrophota bacterium]
MKKILIVDDDEKIRTMYTRFLNAKGFDVVAVSNAVAAHETIRKELVDVTLLDINMPDINGRMLYDVLRSFYKQIKIIVSSVYPKVDQKRMIEHAHEYYDKSEGLDALLEKIKEVLYDGHGHDDTGCR